jgi:hypothetical protein
MPLTLARDCTLVLAAVASPDSIPGRGTHGRLSMCP